MGTIKGYKMYVKYAIYAAECVIDIYEKKYPDDNRPRKAIEAAKKCIENPNEENKLAASYAAYASYAASYAAYASYAASNAAADAADAAYAAAYASYAASNAAADAADAAYAAANAAANAAAYAASAADAMKLKILKYGLELLREGK